MTRFYHTALALVVASAVLPTPGRTQCQPGNPQTNYPPALQTIPAVIGLVGQTSGVPDPHGAATLLIKDASGNPASNVPITVDFSACPDIRICTTQESGTTVFCDGNLKFVTRNTDATGHVTFTIIGSSTNTGASPGCNSVGAAVMTCGNPSSGGYGLIGGMVAAVYDQNGGGMDGGDVALFNADRFSGQYFSRSDYNADWVLNGGDSVLLNAVRFGGQSTGGCISPGSYCP